MVDSEMDSLKNSQNFDRTAYVLTERLKFEKCCILFQFSRNVLRFSHIN